MTTKLLAYFRASSNCLDPINCEIRLVPATLSPIPKEIKVNTTGNVILIALTASALLPGILLTKYISMTS